MADTGTPMDALPEDPAIAIVGTGAVGGYYGARLAQAGLDVRFLMRGDFEHVTRHGVRVRSCHGDFFLPEVKAYRHTEGIGPVDLVLVGLKATANHVLPGLLSPLIGEHTLVMSLQNGFGFEEAVGDLVPAKRLLAGLCFVCINRTGPGEIDHSSQGQVAIGECVGRARPRTHAIAQQMQAANIRAVVAEDLALARWKKLTWNIPFNGLAIAAGGVDVGVLLANPPLRQLCLDLMREVMDIADAEGRPQDPTLPEQYFQRTEQMGPYRPSSMIDYLDGKPVELEAIWGIPLSRARTLGVSVPRLEVLYALLNQLVAKSNS